MLMGLYKNITIKYNLSNYQKRNKKAKSKKKKKKKRASKEFA